MLLQTGGMNSQLTAFCMHPVEVVTGNELHVGGYSEGWSFDGRFSYCKNFAIWSGTNNCLTTRWPLCNAHGSFSMVDYAAEYLQVLLEASLTALP